MSRIQFDDGKSVTLSKETEERLRKELIKEETYHVGQVFKDISMGNLFILVRHKNKRVALLALSSDNGYTKGTDVFGWHFVEDTNSITLDEFKRITHYWRDRKPVNKPLILGE